ncbi:uncharacterized protein B0H64DRAFT_381350 [Chaetomium fimeti]|uniref:Uncharacterized protein n=1 Tax=Chaetomium fimeti TaxID=1854472 RepID=A0AAE0HQC0_9PEZI|nr:hypothetical protein B0H64DRAFT_381350 [Chaetomium fimeti]
MNDADEEPEVYPHPWTAEAWERAGQAVLSGNIPPEPVIRFPVVLTPDGPISSASKLQQLAETESLPEATVTSEVDIHDREISKVTICSLEWDEWERMGEKAHVSYGIGGGGMLVIFEGRQRYAGIVTALKEGVTLEDEDDGGSAGESRGEGVTESPEPANPKPGSDGEPVTET